MQKVDVDKSCTHAADIFQYVIDRSIEAAVVEFVIPGQQEDMLVCGGPCHDSALIVRV